MALVRENSNLCSSEHSMALEKPYANSFTPPGSPTNGSNAPHDSINDLKHLLGKLQSDLTKLPSTPTSQEIDQPRLDTTELEKLLAQLIRNQPSPTVVKPVQSCSVSNEQGVTIPVLDDTAHSPPIYTTPDDFQSFEKWARTDQDGSAQSMAADQSSLLEYTKVLERWNEKSCKYETTETETTEGDRDGLDAYSFVIRERVDRKSEQVTRFIDVKSTQLCDVLRRVLHDVRAVNMIGDKPSVEENILFHFLPELEQAAEALKVRLDCDALSLRHLNLLIGWVMEATTSVSREVSSLLRHGHITYDLLWALFKPGCHVYTTCIGSKEPRCVIFDAGEELTQHDETWFNLECRFLDYDGVKFGEAGVFLRVPKFRGSKPIATLEAYPLHQHPSHEQVRKDLVERGQRFRDFAGSHIQHCKGSAFFMSKGKPVRLNINSRIAVDARFFHEMQPNYSRPSLRDMALKEKDGIAVFDMGAIFMEEREQEKEKMRGDGVEPQKLSEADLLIACPTVCCFSFKEKMFLECAVSALRDVNWSPQSFDCLQIPQENKTLISSMSKTRLGLIPTVPFDDIVDGKGQGLNILLDGPPGVGKTFTVEATSEYFKLPLYSISAGELVVDHGDSNALEQQLETIFKIAHHFKAVLLLDEADAFMEQRTSYHGAHNRLVTVFLRKLEYYQGILFLTSNRGIQFDDAILSRIHLIIKYKDLSREFRRGLWSTFLAKARTVQGPAMIEANDLRRLESLDLNGREIKNIVAIAHALAEANASQVNYKFLELAAGSRQKFSKEFGRQEMYI